MAHIFFLSGEQVSLAKTEVVSLFGPTTNLTPQILLSSQENICLKKATRLGLTKRIYTVLLFAKTIDELLSLTLQNTFKITVHSFSQQAPTSKQLADKLYDVQLTPRVAMRSPQHHYVFFWFDDNIIVTEEIFVNVDQAHLRRSHLKLYNHPTSLHPKIARAMINMANKESFIDPFCGAGGIVIEGGLMGLDVIGSDINHFLITKAKQNAQALQAPVLFYQQDALTLNTQTPAIITDLPYGKNSLLSESLVSLYQKFFVVAQQLTSTLVIGLPSTIPLQELLAGSSWQVQEQFTLYVHKSLSRNIVLLTTSNQTHQ